MRALFVCCGMQNGKRRRVRLFRPFWRANAAFAEEKACPFRFPPGNFSEAQQTGLSAFKNAVSDALEGACAPFFGAENVFAAGKQV